MTLLDRPGCRGVIPARPPDTQPKPDIGEPLPSPLELAWFAADRAMRVAEWPQLRIAPRRVGLTGLRSFFWLDRAPPPVTAVASVPGTVVTAWAEPVRYEWDLGGARVITHHPGRAWTRRRAGNVGRMFETRGSYDIHVDVIWEARWRIDGGPWQHLGYFSNRDSERYPVRQMVAMLTRRR